MAERDLHAEHLVVGAGAAGCSLGYLLRQAGFDVLIIELCDLSSKDKLCGGILGDGALQQLEKIYGADAACELPIFRPPYLRSRCLGREMVQRANFPVLPRRALDRWLLERYIASGGAVRDLVRPISICAQEHALICQDRSGGDTLRIAYDTLVGADGASSAVRRMLAGRKQRVCPSLEGKVAPAGTSIIFSYDLVRTGYCWYIPTGTEANAGCVMYGESARECRAWLDSFCEANALELQGVRGAPIPTGDDILLKAAEDVWLVGDAAGLIDPPTSGGIYHALASARCLASSLTGGAPYEEAIGAFAGMIAGMAEHIGELSMSRAFSILGGAQAVHGGER